MHKLFVKQKSTNNKKMNILGTLLQKFQVYQGVKFVRILYYNII